LPKAQDLAVNFRAGHGIRQAADGVWLISSLLSPEQTARYPEIDTVSEEVLQLVEPPWEFPAGPDGELDKLHEDIKREAFEILDKVVGTAIAWIPDPSRRFRLAAHAVHCCTAHNLAPGLTPRDNGRALFKRLMHFLRDIDTVRRDYMVVTLQRLYPAVVFPHPTAPWNDITREFRQTLHVLDNCRLPLDTALKILNHRMEDRGNVDPEVVAAWCRDPVALARLLRSRYCTAKRLKRGELDNFEPKEDQHDTGRSKKDTGSASHRARVAGALDRAGVRGPGKRSP
jgi:hypothetical protein